MAELDLNQAATGNLENTGTNFSVSPLSTEGAVSKETTFLWHRSQKTNSHAIVETGSHLTSVP